MEYEKFSKFNDWPLMVKMSKFGNVILFKDERLFLVRRHSNQDTLTKVNTLSLQQIVNWNVCFFEAMQIKRRKLWFIDPAFLRFALKGRIFMIGKYYAFMSYENLEKYSIKDLEKIVPECLGFSVYDRGFFYFIYSLYRKTRTMCRKLLTYNIL